MKINMKFKRSILASVFVGLSFSQTLADDPTIKFDTDDPEMNAAIQKARASLPKFWLKFTNHKIEEQGFNLKVRIVDYNGSEHFWCGDIKGEPAKPTCVIDNEPDTVESVKMGERIDVDTAAISDWMYTRGEKIIGGQTIKVMLPHLPPEEAKLYEGRFVDE
jgi:uncharacterized protein YegJ (DUF2314 family)